MLRRVFSLALSVFSSSWLSPLLIALGLLLAFAAGWKGNGLVWEARWEAQRAQLAQELSARIREVRDEEAQAVAASEQTQRSLRAALNEVNQRYENLLADLERMDDGSAGRMPDGERNAPARPDAVPAAAAPACRPCRPCDCGRPRAYVAADKALEMAKERDELAERLNAFILFYSDLREKQGMRPKEVKQDRN